MMAEIWVHETYGSGSQVVTNDDPKSPWLYIYGPGGETEKAEMHNRYEVCEDVKKFLNGGERPAWLDDLVRTSPTHAESLDRTSISAVGPVLDDESPEAKQVRAALMDRLFPEST